MSLPPVITAGKLIRKLKIASRFRERNFSERSCSIRLAPVRLNLSKVFECRDYHNLCLGARGLLAISESSRKRVDQL